MNDFMELRRVVTIILRRWWVLVLLVLIGAGMGYVISRGQTPVYRASTTVLVGESIRSSRVDRVDIQISEALILTYVEIARRQPVLQGVVTTLNLDKSWQELGKQVTVNQIESTQIIEIVVEADSPELARSIADEMVNQLILLSPSSSEGAENQLTNSFNREQITKLQERIVNGQLRLAEIETAINNSISEFELTALQQEKTNLEGLMIEWERNYTQLLTLTEPKRDPTQLTVVEPAHSSNRIVRPRIQLNMLLGGGVGMVLGLALIFLLDFLDDTYRSLKDFSQSEEVNILGSIRRIKGRKLSDKVIAHLQPHSPITESYRIIRSRIRFKRGDNPERSIMVTSSMPGEGRSVTAANLAVVFAQANFKTILVDADFRHPVLHDIFEVDNELGLGDVLSSRGMRVEECIQNSSMDNLQILSSGRDLPDPSWQLGSERMAEIITELKKIAEIVIFDTPPVLVFADAIALSRRVDGVIMVIEAGKSKRSAIDQTLLDLQNANANLLGSVFNQSPKNDTFSVNKVYMQERPKLPLGRVLPKKENQFLDLADSATPLHQENPAAIELDSGKSNVIATESQDLGDSSPLVSENLELPASESEKSGIAEEQFLDLSELEVPAREDFDTSSISSNGFKPAPINLQHDTEITASTNYNKPIQFQDLSDAAAPANEYLELSDLESEKASIDESPMPDSGEPAIAASENQNMPDAESEKVTIAVDEAELHESEDEATLAMESPETPNLEIETVGVDETQIYANSANEAAPPSENLESTALESEAYGGENGTHESKKKRRRKSKRKDLKNEEVPVASPDVPVEQTSE